MPKPSFFAVFVIVFIISCNSDEMKVYTIEVSGTVKENLTGQVVSGASIYSALEVSYPQNDSSIVTGLKTTSNADGNFSFLTKAVTGHTPIGLRRYVIAIQARKSGYTGGKRVQIPYIDGKNTTIDLELIK